MASVQIGMVSQKGGVGKSTLARLIAREYAAAGWTVKIADLDIRQATSTHWKHRRERGALQPEVAVESFRTVEQASRVAPHYDLLVFDGPPYSSDTTMAIAKACQVVIIPTGLCLDDLEPSILVGHELVEKGIEKDRIAFALCKVGESQPEIAEAREYIAKAGYHALNGELPDRTAYRRAHDAGRALSEVRVESLRSKAEELAQSIIDLVTKKQRKSLNANKNTTAAANR